MSAQTIDFLRFLIIFLTIASILKTLESHISQVKEKTTYTCPSCGSHNKPALKERWVKAYYQGGGDYLGEAKDDWYECIDCGFKNSYKKRFMSS